MLLIQHHLKAQTIHEEAKVPGVCIVDRIVGKAK